jgi:muramoyltetrapeptide carboxypeptidase
MIKPRALRLGDRVAVVAPASPFERAEFDAGIAELVRLGLEPVYDDRVFERRGYLAGDATLRAEALRDAWRDPSVAAVIGARGGFGSVQVLPLLDPVEAREARKILVGYSDLTSILTFLTIAAGLVCFHGPMLAGRLGRGVEGYDRDSFLRLLMEKAPAGELHAAGLVSVRAGEASGTLLGGNLTQIVASLGTPFAFAPPAGCVLFLEEVGERPYRLDRMLMQLRLAGVLDRASALVFGELVRCDEPGGEATARAVVEEYARGFPGPVLVGFPSGHTSGPAFTLPLGVKVCIVAGERSFVAIEEAAVE